jgi:hypothetical protein
MRQEIIILLKKKGIPFDMLAMYDSQCGFLKLLFCLRI